MSNEKRAVKVALCGESRGPGQIAEYLRGLGYHDDEIARLLADTPQASYYLVKGPSVEPRRSGWLSVS